MAAIDKLWIKDYWDLEELRRWALIYYRKLLLWLDIDYIEKTFEECKTREAKGYKDLVNATWKRISSDGTVNSAIAYLISQGYSEEEAVDSANNTYKDYKADMKTIYGDIKLSVMNTPWRIDKKLKWICPVPCVREYLQKQCGVKERWYYKLFWRGKKYFRY
jgi:hypothetical protein